VFLIFYRFISATFYPAAASRSPYCYQWATIALSRPVQCKNTTRMCRIFTISVRLLEQRKHLHEFNLSRARGLCSSRPLALSGSPSRCAPGGLWATAPVGGGLTPGARSADKSDTSSHPSEL